MDEVACRQVRMTVAVVGGGASGTLSALHLARTAARAGRALEILIVEPRVVGQGLAYSTPDPRHRLNVAAKGMSAYPDDPERFRCTETGRSSRPDAVETAALAAGRVSRARPRG